ncbi:MULTISPECIES: class 1 fructose-bisphosphatase [Idiomarina]|uniref:class 1 fructose-bisphosphatase n=1 Tax=Idiomarina TaxID=135575 RepID=UPI00129C88B2|nr:MULTISPECIES: class 1 fructose-bisphosphatase [Idiomarina]MRJ42517.1 class 1 fructose-bisphosphatase [Idiomarina sp. FeN1]NCU58131.1 class 1 fructose-bisphosphatase [Idiomarina sp. FenA--70]NCU60829.1 class 1 fructose-bisphosphatase [Idiomarina sp. FenBw--71]UUN13688.1 class 1 fructose-bisphosphatase [Idiomarina loihiensis]
MQRLIPTLRQDQVDEALISVIHSLQITAKEISFRVGQGDLAGVLGSTLSENIQGETQKKLDILSNQLIKDILLECGHVRAVASEEEEGIVLGHENGGYLIAFDPLDGSSNIDINSMVGTIFSILPVPENNSGTADMFLQPGRNQVAAGYILYGPSIMMALTTGKGVKIFTLDQTVGEFLLTKRDLAIAPDTSEFAINMSNYRHWQEGMQLYVDDLLAGTSGQRSKNFNMRWVAAMVADVHRVLIRGGIFLYPWDARSIDKPYKLRLMYEGNPMAMLVEQAGGLAHSGDMAILDIQPTDIHQRVGIILGARNEVNACLGYLKASQ